MADNSGVWIDTKTGQVVNSQPEEGVQLVPAGGTVDADAQKIIDAAETAAKGGDPAPVDEDDTPGEGGGLNSMTKAELQEEADRRGVEIPSGATKAEMIEALGG